MADVDTFAVDREAKLFEAGSYPDKDMDVTEEDLDVMIANHVEAPIRVEHGPSPFDGQIGTLRSLYRKGKELFGRLSFTDAAWAFIKTLPKRALSVGILKDKSGIAEASLVQNPRIPDAQVFSEGIVGFSAELDTEEAVAAASEVVPDPTQIQEVAEMAEITPEVNKTPDPDPLANYSQAQLLEALRQNMPDKSDATAIADYSANVLSILGESREEFKQLINMSQTANKELQEIRMEGHLANLMRDGKLTPAMVPFARGILSHLPLKTTTVKPDELVTFSVVKDGETKEATVHYAEAVLALLNTMPQIYSTSEQILAEGTTDFTAADASMCVKLKITKEQWLEANGRGDVS